MRNKIQKHSQGSAQVIVVIVIVVLLIGALGFVGFNAIRGKNTTGDTTKADAAKKVTLSKSLGTVRAKIETNAFSYKSWSTISVSFGKPTLSKSITNIGKVEQKADVAWLQIPITVTLVKGDDPGLPAGFLELRDASGYRLRPSEMFDNADDTELKPGQSLKGRITFNISQPSDSYTVGIVEPYTGVLRGETKSFALPLADFGTVASPDFTNQPILPTGSVLGDLSGDVSGTTVGQRSTQHYKIKLGKPSASSTPELVTTPAPKGKWLAVPYNVTYVSASSDQDVVGSFIPTENFELRSAKGYRLLPDVVLTGGDTLVNPGDSAKGTLYFDADPKFGPFSVAFIGYGNDEGKTINETKPFNIP